MSVDECRTRSLSQQLFIWMLHSSTEDRRAASKSMTPSVLFTFSVRTAALRHGSHHGCCVCLLHSDGELLAVGGSGECVRACVRACVLTCVYKHVSVL